MRALSPVPSTASCKACWGPMNLNDPVCSKCWGLLLPLDRKEIQEAKLDWLESENDTREELLFRWMGYKYFAVSRAIRARRKARPVEIEDVA